MQGANKTMNTKVGLDLPMSEQVRQRQVILNEGKTLVNTEGVYGSKFGNETHFLSFAAIVATRNGTEGSSLEKYNGHVISSAYNFFVHLLYVNKGIIIIVKHGFCFKSVSSFSSPYMLFSVVFCWRL